MAHIKIDSDRQIFQAAISSVSNTRLDRITQELRNALLNPEAGNFDEENLINNFEEIIITRERDR